MEETATQFSPLTPQSQYSTWHGQACADGDVSHRRAGDLACDESRVQSVFNSAQSPSEKGSSHLALIRPKRKYSKEFGSQITRNLGSLALAFPYAVLQKQLARAMKGVSGVAMQILNISYAAWEGRLLGEFAHLSQQIAKKSISWLDNSAFSMIWGLVEVAFGARGLKPSSWYDLYSFTRSSVKMGVEQRLIHPVIPDYRPRWSCIDDQAGLWVGSYPTHRDFSRLKELKIDFIVNLCVEYPWFFSAAEGIEKIHISDLEDFSPFKEIDMETLRDFAESRMEEKGGGPVLVTISSLYVWYWSGEKDDQGIVMMHCPTVDETPPSREHILAIVRAFANHEKKGWEDTLVHCKSGVGRSVTVVMVLLIYLAYMRGERMSAREAWTYVKDKRDWIDKGLYNREVFNNLRELFIEEGLLEERKTEVQQRIEDTSYRSDASLQSMD